MKRPPRTYRKDEPISQEFAERCANLDRAANYRRIYAEALKDLEARWKPQGVAGQWSGQQRSMARSAAHKIALERLS